MKSSSSECYTTFWMTTIYSDTLHWSDNTPILTLLLIWTLLPNLTFYLIAQGFHRTFAMGTTCQQRTLNSPDTWSCPTLGLASVLMLKLFSPEFVSSPDFRTILGTSNCFKRSLTYPYPRFFSSHVALRVKHSYEEQTWTYRINWQIKTVGQDWILLHGNRKLEIITFTVNGKVKLTVPPDRLEYM